MPRNELEKQEAASRDLIDALRHGSSHAQAPPDFLATVMAQIDHLPPPRRGLLSWLAAAHRWSTPLGSRLAVAVVLIFSLSLNLWWGLSRWRIDGSPRGREASVQVAQYQAAMRSATDVGTFVRAHPAMGEQTTALGFTAQSEEVTYFIIGSWYAEALALLRSNNSDDRAVAVQRVAAMEQAFSRVQAPDALQAYLRLTQRLLEPQGYASDVVGHVLAAFQPLLEEDAQRQGEGKLLLFRAGAWLVNLSLTAAAQDTTLLKQPALLHYFRAALQRLHAPTGVLDALERLTHITEKSVITDADLQEVLQLIRQIQTILAS